MEHMDYLNFVLCFSLCPFFSYTNENGLSSQLLLFQTTMELPHSDQYRVKELNMFDP